MLVSKIVMCTPTATPPRWMIDKHPDMLAIDANGSPRKFGSRRHYCFNHQGYIEDCVRITQVLADRYGADPRIHAWQIDNEDALKLLLPIFVVVTFMAYTTFPLLLLSISLFLQDERSVSKSIGFLSLFTISFIAAILLTYTINWSVHGVFWVPLAEWREATPAHTLMEMRDNLPKLWKTFNAFITKSSFDFYPAQIFHVALMIAATAVLLRYAPLEALYIYAGLITGITLIVLQVLKLGV